MSSPLRSVRMDERSQALRQGAQVLVLLERLTHPPIGDIGGALEAARAHALVERQRVIGPIELVALVTDSEVENPHFMLDAPLECAFEQQPTTRIPAPVARLIARHQ